MAQWVECSPMVRETKVHSQVESYQKLNKWYLISPCLTLSIIKCVSRVKWSNPGKGVAPSPTSRCTSYWNGSLPVALDYGRPIYFTLLIYVSSFLLIFSFLFYINTHTHMYICNITHVVLFSFGRQFYRSTLCIYIYIYIYIVCVRLSVCLCMCACVYIYMVFQYFKNKMIECKSRITNDRVIEITFIVK